MLISASSLDIFRMIIIINWGIYPIRFGNGAPSFANIALDLIIDRASKPFCAFPQPLYMTKKAYYY